MRLKTLILEDFFTKNTKIENDSWSFRTLNHLYTSEA